MSWGGLSYIYSRVEEAAGEIHSRLHYINDPQRKAKYKAFAKHVELVAKALHDVEWVLSSDYGEDGADEAIAKVLSKNVVLKSLVDDAREINGAIDAMLKDWNY